MGNILSTLCLPFMHCIGFTAKGVAKGSLAALIHSWKGVVDAGSSFARCQSAAARSSTCGCICVAICWIVPFLALGFWVFGPPQWLVTNGTIWNSTIHGIEDGAAELWNKTKLFSNGTDLNSTIVASRDFAAQTWNSTKQFSSNFANRTDLNSTVVAGQDIAVQVWNSTKHGADVIWNTTSGLWNSYFKYGTN